MFLHDPVGDCEPEPGTVPDPFGREERVEDLSEVLRQNSLSGIRHLHLHLVVLDEHRPKRDLAAACPHCITSVKDKVGEHLLEFPGVTEYGGHTLGVILYDLDIRLSDLRLEQLQRILQESIDVNLDGFGYASDTRKIEQIADDVGSTLRLPVHLLQERMFNPRFTEEAFNRLKKQKLESFKVQKAQPGAVASTVFAKLNYGPNHIFGVSEEGTEESVKNITLQDIEGYYNNYMTSQDAKVVVVGDIKQEEILPKLQFLNKLPKKKITLPTVAAAPKVDKTKVYLVDVPKSAQSEFRVGYATGLKYDVTGDYYKATLANWALGGNFNSRLNLNLREDKGWTYGAGSGFYGDQYTGGFQFSSGIRADATDSALVEVMKEVNTYLKEGPTTEDVAFMKSAIAQSDARRYETGFQKAAFIERILDYNLPANYIEQQSKILQGMTPAQIKAMAGKYIQPEKLNILLVGDKALIADKVKALGYEIVELDVDGKPVDTKKAF